MFVCMCECVHSHAVHIPPTCPSSTLIGLIDAVQRIWALWGGSSLLCVNYEWAHKALDRLEDNRKESA